MCTLLSAWGKKNPQLSSSYPRRHPKKTENHQCQRWLLQVFNGELSRTVIRILEKQGATGQLGTFLDQCFPKWVPWKMD